MTCFSRGRGRATMVALLVSAVGALAAAPASQAASLTRAEDGWLGFYSPNLRASSQELAATATRNVWGFWSVKGTSTIWDRATDGACAQLTFSIWDENFNNLWWSDKVYKDCDGIQDKVSFSTGVLDAEPRYIYRRVSTGGGSWVDRMAHFYIPS